jgi:hypothetical protein
MRCSLVERETSCNANVRRMGKKKFGSQIVENYFHPPQRSAGFLSLTGEDTGHVIVSLRLNGSQ